MANLTLSTYRDLHKAYDCDAAASNGVDFFGDLETNWGLRPPYKPLARGWVATEGVDSPYFVGRCMQLGQVLKERIPVLARMLHLYHRYHCLWGGVVHDLMDVGVLYSVEEGPLVASVGPPPSPEVRELLFKYKLVEDRCYEVLALVRRMVISMQSSVRLFQVDAHSQSRSAVRWALSWAQYFRTMCHETCLQIGRLWCAVHGWDAAALVCEDGCPDHGSVFQPLLYVSCCGRFGVQRSTEVVSLTRVRTEAGPSMVPVAEWCFN